MELGNTETKIWSENTTPYAKNKRKRQLLENSLATSSDTKIVLSENFYNRRCRYRLVSNDEHLTLLESCDNICTKEDNFCRKHRDVLKNRKTLVCRRLGCLRLSENEKSVYCMEHNICLEFHCSLQRCIGRKFCDKHFSHERRHPKSLKLKPTPEQLQQQEEAQKIIDSNPEIKLFDEELLTMKTNPKKISDMEIRIRNGHQERNIYDRLMEEFEDRQSSERKKQKTWLSSRPESNSLFAYEEYKKN